MYFYSVCLSQLRGDMVDPIMVNQESSVLWFCLTLFVSFSCLHKMNHLEKQDMETVETLRICTIVYNMLS